MMSGNVTFFRAGASYMARGQKENAPKRKEVS